MSESDFGFLATFFWSFGIWERMTHRGEGTARDGVEPGACERSAPSLCTSTVSMAFHRHLVQHSLSDTIIKNIERLQNFLNKLILLETFLIVATAGYF